MNFYQRFPGDYARDTAELSLAEHGAYALLLDSIYATEKPLPGNPLGLYRVCRAQTDDERAAVDRVVSLFFLRTEQGYINDRACSEIESARGRINAARANGKLGGRGQRRTPSDNPLGSRRAPQAEPGGSTPHTHTHKVSPPDGGDKRAARFDAVAALAAHGVGADLARDWLAHRKTRRAQVNANVVGNIAREAGKAGWSMEAALSEAMQRGWTGFKAEWIETPRSLRPNPADVARTTVPGPQGEDPALKKIREDAARAVPPPPEVRAKVNQITKRRA